MHILVVEDDIPLTRQISAALMPDGHDVVVMHDGEAALHAAAESVFDLIVIDIGLPRMDGFELLRRLRSLHVKSRVLMLTVRGEIKDRVTGLQLGADDYLAKPFSMSELVARISALGRRYPEEPVVTLQVGASLVARSCANASGSTNTSTTQNLWKYSSAGSEKNSGSRKSFIPFAMSVIRFTSRY